MLAVEIEESARKLMEAYGSQALAEAAQKARALEEAGDRAQAADWRKIEAALREMRGPRAS